MRFIEARDDAVVQAAWLRRLILLLVYVSILVSNCAWHKLPNLNETLNYWNHLGPHFLQNSSISQVNQSTWATDKETRLVQAWVVDQDLFQGEDFDCGLEIASHILVLDFNALDSFTSQLESHVDDVQPCDTADI